MRTEISRNWEISVFRLVQLFLTLLVFLSTENVSLSLCLSPSCYCMMAKKNANIKRLHRIISTCRVQSIGWCFCAFIWLPAHHITSRYFFKCLCVPNSLHPTPFISDWQQKKKKAKIMACLLSCSVSSWLAPLPCSLVRCLSWLKWSDFPTFKKVNVFLSFLPSPTRLSFQTVLFGFLPQSGAEFRGSPGSFAVWARVACWWASCSLCIIHASRVEGLAV